MMNIQPISINKKLFLNIIIIMTIIVCPASIYAQTYNLGTREYIQLGGQWFINEDSRIGDQVFPNRIVVQLNSGNTPSQLGFSSMNLEVDSGPIANNFYVVKVPPNIDPFVSATLLSNVAEIVNIEFDALGEWSDLPNDAQWNNQWNLKNTNNLDMTNAWEINRGNSSIIVAVIDVGVEYAHEDLADNIWSSVGWDFYDSDADPLPDYTLLQDHHGTAVAGIIGAVTNNDLGVAGIAGGWKSDDPEVSEDVPGVKIMCLRPDFYTIDIGQGIMQKPYLSSVAESVTYAYQNGAKVINLSLGSNNSHSALSAAINTAVNDYGVIVICSSGNNAGMTGPPGDYWYVRFPASMSKTIAVGATISDDTRWEMTSEGSCYGEELDLMGPSIVWTTDLEGPQGVAGNYRSNFGGTSAAAPHVSGLAALILSIYPGFTPEEVKGFMTENADQVGGVNYNQNGWHEEYGYGRIDANSTLSSVREHLGYPPTIPDNLTASAYWVGGSYRPKLTWDANTETNLSGYIVYRTFDGAGSPYDIRAILPKTSTSYIDNDVYISTGRNCDYVHYKLRAYITTRDTSDYTGSVFRRFDDGDCGGGPLRKQLIDDFPLTTPVVYNLYSSFPNPFNPTTTIKFDLPEISLVNLIVYNALGEKVATLINDELDAGFMELMWDGRDGYGNQVASGVYLYTFTAKSLESDKTFTDKKKMILLK